jgi:AmpD protein
LVIHNISLPRGHYGNGYIEQLFRNCLNCSAHEDFADLQGLRVSSHLLIDRAGDTMQFVGLDQRAWHAGHSSYGGRDNCNDFSIGIELEGVDDGVYTEQQYRSLLHLSRQIMINYPQITQDRIVGHCDIAPGRKTDPGTAFDWRYFLAALGAL